MRKTLFWSGWLFLVTLVIIYGIQIYISQDLPKIPVWGWATVVAAILLVISTRNRDEAIHHHLPH